MIPGEIPVARVVLGGRAYRFASLDGAIQAYNMWKGTDTIEIQTVVDTWVDGCIEGPDGRLWKYYPYQA